MTQITFTIEVSDTVAEELEEMPDKNELLADAVSEAVAIGIWKQGARQVPPGGKIFPPPGMAKYVRLIREVDGEVRDSKNFVKRDANRS